MTLPASLPGGVVPTHLWCTLYPVPTRQTFVPPKVRWGTWGSGGGLPGAPGRLGEKGQRHRTDVLTADGANQPCPDSIAPLSPFYPCFQSPAVTRPRAPCCAHGDTRLQRTTHLSGSALGPWLLR